MNRIKHLFTMPFGAGIAGGLVVGLLGWLAIAAGWIGPDADDADTATAAVTRPPLSEPVANDDAMTAGEIFDLAGPAVAYIEAEQTGSPTETPFGPIPGEGGTATGSGFLIDDEGTVLTNAHVVDGARSVTVRLGAGGEPLEAEVLGSDLSTDVAALRVDPGDVEATPLRFAEGRVDVGDAVIAIGSPFGLDSTVTSGIVSGVEREISAPDGQFTIPSAIQTDAAINPGNSGGPLLDASGRVIGINSQIATAGGQGNVGVGFAVPSETVREVTEQLLEDGEAEHAFIGISGADLTPEIAEVLNLDVTEGAIVGDVTPGSPADEAGLRPGDATIGVGGAEIRVGGDVIVSVDGDEVTGMDDVIAAVSDKEPGETIELEVSRDGDSRTVELELVDRPDAQEG